MIDPEEPDPPTPDPPGPETPDPDPPIETATEEDLRAVGRAVFGMHYDGDA